MERIDKILEKVLKKRRIRQKLKEAVIKDQWHSIVGEDLAKVCSPICIKNDIIFIKCINSIWAQELALKKEELIKKVNLYLEEDKIKKVFIKV